MVSLNNINKNNNNNDFIQLQIENEKLKKHNLMLSNT